MRPKHGGELESESWPLETNGWLDFSVNLNPFAEFLSEQEWLNARELMFQYPPPASQSLDSTIAAYLGLPDSQQVIATRGGMEALRFALQKHRGKTVHIPTPCFSEYIYLCEQLGMDYQLHSVAESDWCEPTAWLSFPLEPGSVWLFGNPNNPFGHAIKRSELLSILKRITEEDIHWIIDEAFVDLTGKRDDFSAVSLMGDFSNVTIAGSLTKSWSIPGLRLGFLLSSNHQKLEAIRGQQETWIHGSLTHYWAQTMLQPDRILVHLQQLTQIAAIRDAFFSEINASQFIRVYPSEVNYGVCEWTPGSEGADLNAFFLFLNKQRIHVRECDSIPGIPVGRFFRVAVRKPEENKRFLEAIHAFERENPFNKGSI